MKIEQLGACGVWIEFLNDRGDTVAQHVVDEWHGRPVPDRGDYVDFADVVGVRLHKGVVIGRRFDLQHSVDGVPQVWVRLVIRIEEVHDAIKARKYGCPSFSTN
jgi:hypothetical protein